MHLAYNLLLLMVCCFNSIMNCTMLYWTYSCSILNSCWPLHAVAVRMSSACSVICRLTELPCIKLSHFSHLVRMPLHRNNYVSMDHMTIEYWGFNFALLLCAVSLLVRLVSVLVLLAVVVVWLLLIIPLLLQ